MTTQDKNVEIALMLGWKKYNGLNPKWNNSFEPTLTTATFDKVVTLLKFDSDANWQFAAINFIHSLEKDSYDISKYICQYSYRQGHYFEIREREDINTKLVDSFGDTMNQSIFEVLYQFSQYLKTIK